MVSNMRPELARLKAKYEHKPKESEITEDNIPLWISKLYELQTSSSSVELLDFMFDGIDTLKCSGDYKMVDLVLRSVDPNRLEVLPLVTLMVMTKRIEHLLVYRTLFATQAIKRINELAPERADALLLGIK